MVKGAPGNLQKEKIINKRKHAGRRPIGIKYFEARMVYRLRQKTGFKSRKSFYLKHLRKQAIHHYSELPVKHLNSVVLIV